MNNQIRLLLDDRTLEHAQALAKANYPQPRGAGNVSALVRSLVAQAWLYPERFGLMPPGAAEVPRATVEEELAKGQQAEPKERR